MWKIHTSPILMNPLLSSTLTLTHNQLSAFSSLDSFWQVFDTAFGTQYNRRIAEILRLQWQAGDFSQIPQIEILDSSILGNANGAYASSTNKIYLSDTFVATATPAAISALLLEEIGHFVDSQINLTDSAGDEGAIFAELVQGYSLDDATLQALQAEDDSATITVNGQTIQVEQQNFTGTSGSDNITGTSDDDVIQGLGGNDTLSGQGGNDQLFGGTGSDTLTGGTGQDQFVFEYFNGSSIAQDLDVVTDFVQGEDKIDLRNVGIADYQTLSYLISDDSLSNAVIAARYNNSSSSIYGYRLRINGFSSSQLAATDFIFSTSVVNDTITGTNNSDDLFGGLGNDILQGSGGNDRLFGEQGDDRFLGGTGSDNFYGGTGLDTFVFEYFNGSSIAQDLDIVSDFVQGQDKIDLRTVGIADYQTLLTLISDDSLGNAVIAARYNNSSNPIYGYKLKINGFSNSQLAATDFIFSTLVVNDNFTGTNNSDDLFGGLGNDTLQGSGGDDRLFGEQGDDRFLGGTGSDTLTGGTGLDQFIFEYFNGSTLSQDLDVVTDFVQGEDKIDLRTVGIADYQTLLTLISDDSLGNAVIAARYNNSSNPIYGYKLKINGFSSSQLAATDFIFSTLVVNDTITGTNNSDDLFGGLGNDNLQGSGGDDRLFGEQGDDRFLGGTGSDTFYGGTGQDQFVFEYFTGFTNSQDLDVVTDFVKGQDKIDLRNIGIADYQTLLTLISDDVLGNALITTRKNNSTGDYRMQIDGFSSSQLAATDYILSTSVVNDTITGTNNRDDLFGGLGNDTLQGQNGNDRLFGEQGDDRLFGGIGNDSLYGGEGSDTAVYSGTRSQYQITSNAGVFTITDSVANRDGIDTLYGVEKVQFSDQIITIGDVALPSITLAVSPASVTEDGAANLVYTFTRTGSTTNALTVNYSIGGTAANTDYTGATRGTGKTITFAA
ncbi:sodium:calcium exchanger, partial [Aphanizomenon flos-aquae CCAP 1446/1C]|nr:sodium:calcium exchanger [Anabaena sp. CCAP 1446/1C]